MFYTSLVMSDEAGTWKICVKYPWNSNPYPIEPHSIDSDVYHSLILSYILQLIFITL